MRANSSPGTFIAWPPRAVLRCRSDSKRKSKDEDDDEDSDDADGMFHRRLPVVVSRF